MRKLYGLILSVMMGGLLFGQGAEVPNKIAFVNTTAVLQRTAEGKQRLAELQQFIEAQQQQLADLQSELQELRQQYDSQARMLNPDTASEMQRSIQEKERQLRRAQEDMELDVNQRRNEILNQMSQKIQTVISAYAEENGFGVVFQETPSLPYFAPALDITAEIIRIYDEQNPVEGTADETAPVQDTGTPQP